jgi:hypothetical protein
VLGRRLKWDLHGPRRDDSLPEAFADGQAAPPDARPGQDVDLMTARHKLGGDGQDEGDVATALKHREEDACLPITW